MKPILNWLENPEIFAVNREPAHSDHSFTVDNAQFKQSLDGIWKFNYSDNLQKRPAEFYKEDFSVDNFDEIKVPAHIQLQGYGSCRYVNYQYPWDGHERPEPPQIPYKFNPVGSYVNFFDLDRNLLGGKDIYISFQGVETAFFVWLNGQFVGYSEDSFTPSEFKITPFLREKNNRLAVEVYAYSSSSWLEDQDFWRFSGIFRSVFLYAVPEIHVRDMKITADYDYKNGCGILTSELDITSESDFSLRLSLTDSAKNLVTESKYNFKEFVIPNIKPWSAEQPSLYKFTAEIFDANGKIIETASCHIGFRRFELKNGLMLLNGKRIIFKGVNRHEFCAENGRCITEKEMLHDILLLKRSNINAVRTCHYPNQSRWYELCDEYGIYLIDETNLETHGTWAKNGGGADAGVPASLPEWKPAVLDRAKSMFERDKNHASVLIWSCGNESTCGTVIADEAAYFHENDKTRLVHYEGVTSSRSFDYITDMESRMYAVPDDIEQYLKNNPSKPYISCEYMHAMGNSLGGMSLYTDLEDKYPSYQGGFIWDYIDQALFKTDKNGRKILAYGGDFGDRPNDGVFCTNGIVYADRTPSPKLQEVKALYSNIKMKLNNNVLTVYNKNLFVSSDIYVFVITLEKEGKIIAEESHRLSIQPESSGFVSSELHVPDIAGEYVMTASARLAEDTLWAEAGYEIAFAQEVIRIDKPAETLSGCTAEIVHGDFCTGIHGKDFSMLFDRSSGIISFIYSGREFMTKAPQVSFWRAPTDNDSGCAYPFEAAQWQIAGKYARYIGGDPICTETEDSLTLEYKFKAASSPSFVYSVKYTAYYNGILEITAEYPGTAGLSDMPVFAVDFRMDEKYKNFTYYGMGPEENYSDRCFGAKLGVFSSDAHKNFSGYLNPQECGSRTGVRFIRLYDESGNGLEFKASSLPFEMSVLPCSSYELDNASHREELPESGFVWLRIAAKQSGVGGDDSWGAPVHKEYKIPSSEPISLSFTVSPIASQITD